MTVNNESEKTNLGRSWNVERNFNTFSEADEARTIFLKKNEKMQAKIKYRRSKNNYVLKTRLLAEFVKQENKKRGKNKRRNKKTWSRGKLDTSSAVWEVSSFSQTSIWRNPRRKFSFRRKKQAA